MRRLKTDYIDVVLCHDVEFVEFDQVVGDNGALKGLFQLKAEGKINYVGCSGKVYVTWGLEYAHSYFLHCPGYPLPVLLKIAQHQHEKGQPLDVILSYSHYNLQNTSLSDYTPLFRQAGVRYILNASPLNMALFRDAGPPDWHPAHAQLRQAAHQCAQLAKDNGLNISTLASMFAFRGRSTFQLDSTVIGLERKEEVQQAIRAWKKVKAQESGSELVPAVEISVLDQIDALLKPYKNYSWQSPSQKELGLV